MKIKRKIRFPRDVLIRMTVLMIALTNQILELTGRNPLPFSEEEWYQILSGMVTVRLLYGSGSKMKRKRKEIMEDRKDGK